MHVGTDLNVVDGTSWRQEFAAYMQATAARSKLSKKTVEFRLLIFHTGMTPAASRLAPQPFAHGSHSRTCCTRTVAVECRNEVSSLL